VIVSLAGMPGLTADCHADITPPGSQPPRRR